MAKVDDKIMKMVEAELGKDPGVSNEELFKKARKINRGIGKLSPRQFHARYPLQVKRKATLADPKRSRKKKQAKRSRQSGKPRSSASAHEAVRKAFLDFASDLTAAQERNALVRVLADVDKYVDRAIKAAK